MSTRPGSTLDAMALTSLGPEELDDPELPLPVLPELPELPKAPPLPKGEPLTEGAPRGAGASRGVGAARPGSRWQAGAARGRAEGLRAAAVVGRCVPDAEAGTQDRQRGGSGQEAVAHAVIAAAGCRARGRGRWPHGGPGVGGRGTAERRRRRGCGTEHRVARQGAHGVRALGGVELASGVGSCASPVGGVSACWGRGRGCCSGGGGVAAGIGMAAWLVASGGAVGAVSGSPTGPPATLSFWSSVMSAVLRLSSGGPGSPRHPLDTSGLYARSEKVMTRINVVCATRTAVKTSVNPEKGARAVTRRDPPRATRS